MEGILFPLITPFAEDGEVDERMFRSLIDDAIVMGVDALFILGSVGQGPALTYEERARCARIAIEEIRGRVPSIIHVGTTDLRSTAELAVHAKAIGADAIAVVPPYYYSDHTQAEIDLHFEGVAAACDLPLVVYNNPKYAGTNISAPWLARLAKKIPSISGIKLSYASTPQTLQYVQEVPGRVSIYSGSVVNLLPTVPYGVKGTISPPSILFPKLSIAIWNALKTRDWNRAILLQERVNRASMIIEAMMAKEGRVVIQEGLRMLGHEIRRYPRWATPALAESAKDSLRTTMEDANSFESAAAAA